MGWTNTQSPWKRPNCHQSLQTNIFFFFFVYEAIFYVGGGHGVDHFEPEPSDASSSLPSLFSRICKNPRPPISPKVSFFSIFMVPFFVLCVWLSLAPAAHSLFVVMCQRAFAPLRVAWKVRIVVSKIEVFLVINKTMIVKLRLVVQSLHQLIC